MKGVSLTPEAQYEPCDHPPAAWEQCYPHAGLCTKCCRFLWGTLAAGRSQLPPGCKLETLPA